MTENSPSTKDVERSEVLFYHLERQSLEEVLPTLLEKTLQRGWRAVVQSGSKERLDSLDLALWTYRDDRFLPHAIAGVLDDEMQPILLTLESGEPANNAGIKFLVDGATVQNFSGFSRIVCLFDGLSEDAVNQAREHWTRAKADGCAVTYWQQTANGGWQKKA